MSTQQRSINTVPDTRLVVITDLDGTLLDHTDYSARPARAALQRLREQGVPVIFNTSKTCDEVLRLRHDLDNTDPFVCENGSVIYLPKADGQGYNSEVLGITYVEILKALHTLRKRGFRFRGFNDMPTSEVAALTGLDEDNAWLAKKRAASEPLLWTDNQHDIEEFQTQLTEFRLTLTRGGRFYHVMGDTNKASGLEFFRQYYQHLWQGPVVVAALGDGENDRSMLDAADYPIVIPGHTSTLTISHPAVTIAKAKGPTGWNSAILDLLQRLTTES